MTVTAPDALRSVPLFEGMSEASITSIGGLMHPIGYRTGDVLVREGDPGDSFIILLSGRAAVDQGGQRIREMSAGEGCLLEDLRVVDADGAEASVIGLLGIGESLPGSQRVVEELGEETHQSLGIRVTTTG